MSSRLRQIEAEAAEAAAVRVAEKAKAAELKRLQRESAAREAEASLLERHPEIASMNGEQARGVGFEHAPLAQPRSVGWASNTRT